MTDEAWNTCLEPDGFAAAQAERWAAEHSGLDNRKTQVDKYLKRERRGEPRTYKVSTVSEFVELTTWLYTSKNVAFRGQTKEVDWPLVPAVGRLMKGSSFFRREQEMLEEFKRESVPYLQVRPQNNWQWLSIAQHNGLPTRLLDWTRNPLAALWFTVGKPAKAESPGIVWAYSFEKADAITDSDGILDPFSIEHPYVYHPEHLFPYIKAQSGMFTVHPKEQGDPGRFPPLEEIKNADLILTRIEIPPSYFAAARYHLFRLGVSPASLFPGLQGLVDRIRYDNMLGEDEKAIYWPPNPGDGASG